MTEPIRDIDALKAFNANIIDQFRANAGKVGDQFEGADLLVLTTTGAKSGHRRLNPLQSVRSRGAMIVVGAYAGADVDPAWVHNLRANPRAHVEVGTDSFDVIARELPPAERKHAWAQVIDAEPGFAEHQAKTSRVLPIFELRPV
ncbi:MAG: nitroreductase family deazaflavin-dependent oxidoreductase [Mycobacterium sp.]|nr:nitroreductase family deazaflavin-dependent oxidoreductase [Mycobacterium sp.]